MHAAVVRSFDTLPRYEEFATPTPTDGQVVVDMLAAGLHPRVRSGANGTHYTSDGRLPMIPGVAERVGDAAADVDVVIDYTWGAPTQRAIPALLTRRAERGKPLDWIQIGSMAGAEITLPSFVPRAANLRIMGSGQGSLTTAGIVAELPSLIDQFAEGTLTAAALPVPLAEVETAWDAPTKPGQRVVFTTSA
jgi:NADPH:quinone reductase-like Zn-dependent oxidoreductase